MRKNSLKFKKYFAGILLVLVVAALIGVLKFGNLDKLKGKIKVEDVYLSSINTKLNANVYDATGTNPVVSNGYDEVNYELKYKLSDSNQNRKVKIVGRIDSDNGYASFKRLVGDNITSTLKEDNRVIEIEISNVPANEEITTNIAVAITGAPNGYKVNPSFQIKESTEEEYTNIYTNPIEVSTNNVRGTVRDLEGELIPNILVTIYKGRNQIRETYANENGEYIFSDLEAGSYQIKINEEIYQEVNVEEATVDGDTVVDLTVKRIYPFTVEVHKYITKIDATNLGDKILKTYDNASTVALPIKKLTNFEGKVYYKIVVENTGEKEGILSAIKDEMPEYMEFDESENSGFELKNGYIYDRNLEGKVLSAGEKVEDTLVLRIKNTKEARTYLNRVNALGEIYEHVVYILDGNTYREEDVLEGEKTERPSDPVENFSGWYTDSKYTNKYNFNNIVTKDLILYGKTGVKYKVEFYDKDPETGDEDLYKEETVKGGDPVDEPEDHPEHTGYDFDYWCTTDFIEYNFNLPVNSDLKLINCTTIKKYDVNFYNYEDTVEKTVKIEYKKQVSQSDAPALTEEAGYVFICWTEDKQNCFDFTTPIVKKTDLYPKHEQLTNAVVFNDENRVTTINDIPYGNTVDPIADQGKEGHTFRCWSEDRINCFDFNTPIIENKTLYAEYDIKKYNVTFIDRDPELGTDTQYGEVQIIEWGEKATRPETDPSHYGYTFNSWTKDNTTYDFNTPVKSDLIIVSKYDINSYPVNFHDGNDVTTVNVVYKNKVTPITSPSKEHHIFLAWLDENDAAFDFDTLIIKETDLYSSYEEVLAPTISHTPTMWTNENVTVTLHHNPALTNTEGYSYLYKTTNTDYATYENPFSISENTTVIAKGVKSEVDSEVTNHEIVNIDKLNPSITLFSENVVTKNTAVLNVSALDNESGVNYYEVYQDNVKIGEKQLECYNENTFDAYEACRANYPTERATTYQVTGLTPNTTYVFKVKVFDKAGNYIMSDDLEITTPEARIVARLIGYNNQLFTDTIDEQTGDVLVPKEDKYINFESLEEAFDYEDLYDCKNVQCTIQMVTSTNESVEVIEGQDLTLDLNGKTVAGIIPDYTIKNNSYFTLIESTPEGQEPGQLVNNQGIALLNKTGCHFTMGEGYSDVLVATSLVSTTKPYIYGETVGVKSETNAYFTMFDGKIVAPASQTPGYGAVNGKVTGTEYSYSAVSNNQTINEADYQVVTLNQLIDPEARINQAVYYSKLSSAMDNATRGQTNVVTEDTTRSLMENLKPASIYNFEYDDTTGTWVSHSGPTSQQHAKSYLVIDLRNETNDKVLKIDYETQLGTTTESNFYNYFTNSNISNRHSNITVNEYTNYDDKVIGDSVSPFLRDYTNYGFELEKGKIYIVNFEHYLLNTNWSEMTIKDITLSDLSKNTDNVNVQNDISEYSYGFYYDETDKKIKSNNQYNAETSTAYGYVEIDLTDKSSSDYYYISVDAVMESYSTYVNWDQGVYSDASVKIGDSKDRDNGITALSFTRNFDEGRLDNFIRYDTNGNYGGYNSYGPYAYTYSVTGGKKYYVKFIYSKYVYYPEAFPSRETFESYDCHDQLIINSIDVFKYNSSNATTIPINETRKIDNDIMTQMLDNSNGTFIEDGDTIRTNNTSPNQYSDTTATIDLTNETKGMTLILDYTKTYGINGSSTFLISSPTIGTNSSITPTCTNCIGVMQKRTVNGAEKYLPVSIFDDSTSSYTDPKRIKGYYVYELEAGYEYLIKVNVCTSSSTGTEYPNFVVNNMFLVEPTAFKGNYYTGISSSYMRNWIDQNPEDEYRNRIQLVATDMTYKFSDTFKDSFIKIDLTNYDKDQVLYYNSWKYPYYPREIVYLTNNNRSFTAEEAFNNRGQAYLYDYKNSGSYYIVLEKGKVYYLHYGALGYRDANNSSYTNPSQLNSYDWTTKLAEMKLYPIDETIATIGGTNVFTGTVDIANEREERSTTKKRTSEEPTVISVDDEIYGFDYNDETETYNALNTEYGTAAMKTLKIDLTGAATDRTYTFESTGGLRNYYAYGESMNDIKINLSTYVSSYSLNNATPQYYNDTIPGYHNIEKEPTFTLEKGKVHYVQVITYNADSYYYNMYGLLSFKLIEMNNTNETNNYYAPVQTREFNEQVDTVQLLRDVNTQNTLKVEYAEDVVLDLNGYSLTSTQDYVINNKGDLEIIDSKYDSMKATYDQDLAEYQEYMGLCDGCSPSEEYKVEHIQDFLDEYSSSLDTTNTPTTFEYTGDVQTFVAPETGLYKLQVWGAQGGTRSGNSAYGGKGGYSEGIIKLEEGETVYVYVGGSGDTGGPSGGFNGGGTRTTYNGGGGATDIRVEGNSLYNRIIVAGGGGSDGAADKPGKAGGGLTGISATERCGKGGEGGTQTGSPGYTTQQYHSSFGSGGKGISSSGGHGGAGGGGWYGGNGAQPDYGSDDDRGGGGGSGFIYTDTSTTPVSGYLVKNHYLVSATTLDGTVTTIPTHDGTGTMTGNEGDGYATIQLVMSNDTITELYSNVQKKYNVKTQPVLSEKAALSNNSGTGIIKNNENATLTLRNIILNVSAPQGIYNEGLIIARDEPVINVNGRNSTGIANVSAGEIVNNGNLIIKLNSPTRCSNSREYGATGLSYSIGTHEVSNINITGVNGTGIMVDASTTVNIHSSNINTPDDKTVLTTGYGTTGCGFGNLEIAYSDGYTYADPTNTSVGLYGKKYSIPIKYSNSTYNRNDGVIYNKGGNINVSDGTTLTGTIKNFGKMNIYDGVGFNEISQTDRYKYSSLYVFDSPEINIYNTVANVERIVNQAGTINVIEEDGHNSSISSSNSPAILNMGTFNSTGGSISGVYNVGVFNSNDTDIGLLYNLLTNTYMSTGNSTAEYHTSHYTVRGTANLNGGTITNKRLVNEYNMTIDGVTVPNGIVNRGNLTVKGDSVVTGTDVPAIRNYPMLLRIYRTTLNGSTSILGYGYGKVSLTLGEDDGEVTTGPTITSNTGYAITGTCNSHGTTGMELDTISFTKGWTGSASSETLTFNLRNNETYLNSSNYLINSGRTVLTSSNYPNSSNNLCQMNYYDGNIHSDAITDITDVMDIPITNVASGYDVLYDNSNLTGDVTLAAIDDSSRADVIDVNGTPYKSLQTAITNAPDNSIINISGNYDSANKVTIPEGKNLTINYLSGVKLNSYSKDALITNNGGLTITGDGTDNIIGEFAYENNGTMAFNGSNNTNNVDFYYKQSNLIKNNSNLTINEVSSDKLDIISLGEDEAHSSITINDGTFDSNTIHGKNTDVIAKGGYFTTVQNNDYFEVNKNTSLNNVISRTKAMFNVTNSNVTLDGFDMDDDTRYSSGTTQNLGIFTSSTLNLNNSIYGKDSTSTYINMYSSNININGGRYDKPVVNLMGGDTYTQTSGVVNGSLVAGGINNINVIGGKINSPTDTGILMVNSSGSNVTVGTKGDLVPGTNRLNVSKTDPEISGGTYGISVGGSSFAANKLYFYDGIFKGGGNPIDFHVEEIEEGYDVVYNRDVSPQEKYLDKLPTIYNVTSDTYYLEPQDAFNAANEDDELIWIRDYTNFADTPSLVIPSGKKFTLYLSYIQSIPVTPVYYQYYFIDENNNQTYEDIQLPYVYAPYSGTETVSSGTIGASIININNGTAVDPDTGETYKVPFLVNNGDVTIIAAATSPTSSTGALAVDTNFESVSGATIIKNNNTVTMKGVTAVNVKAFGTLFENNGLMNVVQGHFEVLQANVFTNNSNSVLNISGTSSSESCFEPTYIKIHRTQSLEDDYNIYKGRPSVDNHTFFRETIINNTDAIANINQLYIDADYAYILVLNDGTMNLSGSIEQYRNDSLGNTMTVDNPIINNGQMNFSGNLYSTKGIKNNGTLTYAGNLNAGYDAGITNYGTLTFTGSITGAGKGILDYGNTTVNNGYISTYEEAYYGTGGFETTLKGQFYSYGKRVETYSVSQILVKSCNASGSSTSQSFSGTLRYEDHKGPWKYTLNNGIIYAGNGRTLKIDGASINFDSSLTNLAHFCGTYYYWENGNRYSAYECKQPYSHYNETGSNYTVASIELNNANFVYTNGGINDSSSDYTRGLYSTNSSVSLQGGSISSAYIYNYRDDKYVTFGVKDGVNTDSSTWVGKLGCYPDSKGINMYAGSFTFWMDYDNLCHFEDKEDGYNISSTHGSPYGIRQDTNIVRNLNKPDGDTYVGYNTIEEAINEATPGDTILFDGVSNSYPKDEYDLNVNKDITFDLNGTVQDFNLNVTGGNVNITDSAYLEDNTKTQGRITSINNTSGTVTTNGVIVDKIVNNSTSTITNGKVTEATNTTGTLNITGGNVSSLYSHDSTTLSGTTVNTLLNYEDSDLSMVNSRVSNRLDNYSSFTMDENSSINELNNYAPLTLTAGSINTLKNYRALTISGARVTGVLTNDSDNEPVIVNSGSINTFENKCSQCEFNINGGTLSELKNRLATSNTIINGGIVKYIVNGTDGYSAGLTILGGTIGSVNNTKSSRLTVGSKDGIVNTNSPHFITTDEYTTVYGRSYTGYYSIVSTTTGTVNFYDGSFTSPNVNVLNTNITDSEPGYSIYIAPDYDGEGDLTGTYTMTLKPIADVDTKIACVEGICYDTVQDAIDASVRNYTEADGCPEVMISSEFYFAVELDADLVLDPQYTLTINLNQHNLNDNGHVIPDNITLRNGSRNGTDLQSSLSRFLANVLGGNDTTKDIIITKMSDGKALDTSKTYKLYKYEDGSYKPIKVDSDGAGHYNIGNDTLELKSIKGRVYISKLSAGEYMLKDNLDTELEFNVYEDGTLSPNIKENITTDYGRMTASAVATLIVTIQTGVTRYGYILLGIMFIIAVITVLSLYRKSKSIKETI